MMMEPGLLSRYSDSLQTVQSGDRIPMEATFSASVQTGLWPTQLPISWVPALSPEVKRPGRVVDHPPHLAPRLKEEWSYSLFPLSAFVACSMVNINFTLLYFSKHHKRQTRLSFSDTWSLSLIVPE